MWYGETAAPSGAWSKYLQKTVSLTINILLSGESIWHFYQRQGQRLWSLKNCRKLWAHPNYVNSRSIKNVIWIILGIVNIRRGLCRTGEAGCQRVRERERASERESEGVRSAGERFSSPDGVLNADRRVIRQQHTSFPTTDNNKNKPKREMVQSETTRNV